MRRRTALALTGLLVPAAALAAQPWRNYGRDAQHSAHAPARAQPLEEIHWQTPVDLQPQYSQGGELFIHYGTPLVTKRNTVVLPVKTGIDGEFRVEGRSGRTGDLLWTFATDYELPPHGWTPSCGVCLAAGDRVVAPALGGTVLVLEKPDTATDPVAPDRVAFFGDAAYAANKAAYDANVRICSPVVSAANGDLYFAFLAGVGAPQGLTSGIARIPAKGPPVWISAADAADDMSVTRPAMNAAPALSPNGRTLYVAVTGGPGYVCALDAKTLLRKASVRLKDVLEPNEDAEILDDGTASPAVGPDGDVYFGVFEGGTSFNFFRGWLLHFDASLSTSKTPGSFGWDDTASIVPKSAVPSYRGRSKYLVLTKYNDYASVGGTGVNRLAVLDPNASQVDARTSATVMAEVLTIAGPTPDPENRDAQHPDAVREWCINTAAIDVKGRCALVNNEDGVLYRWDFRRNTLLQSLVLTQGIGEAYTPTIVGPDGQVYAINDATLFAVGRKAK